MRENISKIDEMDDARNYWHKKMAGCVGIDNLPYDYPAVHSVEKKKYSFTIEKDLTENLLRLSKDQDILLYIVLMSAFKIILFKLTDQHDLTLVTPGYKVDNDNNRDYIFLRSFIKQSGTFKEFLMEIKQAVLDGFNNQHYTPRELFRTLESETKPEVLHRVAFILENIQNKDALALVADSNELTLSLKKEESALTGNIIYNGKLLSDSIIAEITGCFITILKQIGNNIAINISDITLMDNEKSDKIVTDFSVSERSDLNNLTVNEWFEKIVKENADKSALSVNEDLQDVYNELESRENKSALNDRIANCLFKKNEFLFIKKISGTNKARPEENKAFYLVRTYRNDCLVINDDTLALLNCFEGKLNVKKSYTRVGETAFKPYIHILDSEIGPGPADKDELRKASRILLSGDDLIALIKVLYQKHIIDLAGYDFEDKSCLENYTFLSSAQVNGNSANDSINICLPREDLSKAPVLLLGDTPGNPSVGLLYLASYLKKHDIKAYCRFSDNNWNEETLKEHTHYLLEKIEPEIVGISMKWFPHMARVLEIAKIVKDFSPDIKVVLGGDTASFFSEQLIINEQIDYIVKGDGELPLLKIAQNADDIPNCVYKKSGTIISNPITYVQNEEFTRDIQLGDLKDIVVSKEASLFSTFFVPLYKGCSMPCFYCGGCKSAQTKIFNRKSAFFRKTEEVRHDIIQAKNHTSAFMFDLDVPGNNTVDYFEQICKGLDLSSHFGVIFAMEPPSAQLIKVLCSTFKYVRLNLDLCSLSERHRNELYSRGLVKPQSSDSQIFEFFANCDTYKNVEVDINLIAGLPFFTEKDIVESESTLNRIIKNYTSFTALHWGRLHSQPGTMISTDSNKFDMLSYGQDFNDFLQHSRQNVSTKPYYPNLMHLKYPFIYYKNDELNSSISKHYTEMNMKSSLHRKQKRRNISIFREYTYDLINRKANQLARTLRKKNFLPNSVAALLLDKPLDVVVGIMGVLKAGGAYLPVDPEYPENRIKYIVEDSKASFLISGATGKMSGEASCTVINMDDPQIKNEEESDLECINKPEDLMYIIYTSGSTGEPKGIMVEHSGVVNFINWRLDTYGFSANDVTLQLLPYSFDGSGTNLYSSLLSGGTLVLPDNIHRKDFKSMGTLIDAKKITNISLVPSMYAMILDGAAQVSLDSLKFVILAGEKSSKDLIALSRKKSPSTLLINEYGPTENSITTTSYMGISLDNPAVIGKPIANVQVFILNRYNDLMPVGIPGELCIAGAGLARGYVSEDAGKAGKFIPNPFDNNSRMYKTGDIVKWLPDGNIEYLGRMDNQIKIRGFRIELSEIEHQLVQCNNIKAAVVLPRENETQSTYLSAYIVTNKEVNTLDLRKQLAERLPDYMIPATFTQVEKMPVTANGKVDIKALLNMSGTSINSGTQRVSAKTKTQKFVAGIWAKILNKPIVSIHENFFDVGGNSLLLMEVHGLIDSQYPGLITVPDLFTYRTISGLSGYIDSLYSSSTLSINSIKLPHEYLPEGPSDSNREQFEFKIDGDLRDLLRIKARQEGIQVDELVAFFYLYTWAEISEYKQAEMYTNIVGTKKLTSYFLDAAAADSIELFFKALKEEIHTKSTSEGKLLHDISHFLINKESNEIIPLLYKRDTALSRSELLDYFEIILQTDAKEDSITFLVEYNPGKIKGEKVEEFMIKYVGFMEYAITQTQAVV